jgi:hypothetical protein
MNNKFGSMCEQANSSSLYYTVTWDIFADFLLSLSLSIYIYIYHIVLMVVVLSHIICSFLFARLR